MKIRALLVSILLLAASVTASENIYSVSRGEWHFIPVAMPEAKVGGGDFYTLQVTEDADNGSIKYTLETDGIRVRPEDEGEFDLQVVVHHITKSSCAGVDVSQHRSETIVLRVME